MFKKSFLSILIVIVSAVFLNAQSLRFSSDGKTLGANWILPFGDYTKINQILMFDTASGKVKFSFNADDSNLEKAMFIFTPGNQGVIVGERDGSSTLKITADNQISNEDFESESKYDKDFIGIALSADGKFLYKVYADELIAYNLLTKKAVPEEGKKPSVNPGNQFLAIDSGGRFLVEYQKRGKEYSLLIHNLETKKMQAIKLPYNFEDDKKIKIDVQFSENGDRIAVECEVDEEKSQITVWDLKSGLSQGNFSVSSLKEDNPTDFYPVEKIAFSPDGKKLAVKINDGFNDDLKNLLFLWDVSTKKETLTGAKKYSEEIFADQFTFSPDSKHLAISSQIILPTSLSLKIQFIDANTGSFIREF
jgi:WD40 repeat protein